MIIEYQAAESWGKRSNDELRVSGNPASPRFSTIQIALAVLLGADLETGRALSMVLSLRLALAATPLPELLAPKGHIRYNI